MYEFTVYKSHFIFSTFSFNKIQVGKINLYALIGSALVALVRDKFGSGFYEVELKVNIPENKLLSDYFNTGLDHEIKLLKKALRKNKIYLSKVEYITQI